MNKKKSNKEKKLVLAKETLSNLTLEQVSGGAPRTSGYSAEKCFCSVCTKHDCYSRPPTGGGVIAAD
jgi:hypothetical protein